jgi:malate synthase
VSSGIDIRSPMEEGFERILTPDAVGFVAELQREFGARRSSLLAGRAERMERLEGGELPDFLTSTRDVREGEWEVPRLPDDLSDRRVEITGPTDRKMVINALNSGASAFMADFEDANSPTWKNMVGGHVNLIDAIDRTIDFVSPDGREYRLREETATLMVRPRGWHLEERHFLVDGAPCSGSLFDFGLHFFHNAGRLIERGSGPYFYLPKLEGHLEARLWNDVFLFAQDRLGLPHGTIKATVLIETILAAFEMDEILFELREHSAGLNAGRWDYIFSIIKKFRSRPDFLLPDRAQVTMTVPFMRSYTELLVKTCHRRNAFAIGGMAAFIPSRRDPEVNEVALGKVREDKVREAGAGFDGTWVAHPDLVPVAKEVFDAALGDRPNQLTRRRDAVEVGSSDLLRVDVPGGSITEQGLRGNVSIAILYLESWLRGVGAAAMFNLMEDTATAEISRSQVWQWIAHRAQLEGGGSVTRDLVDRILEEELAGIREAMGADAFAGGRFAEAAQIFRTVSLSDEFTEFLTLPAYDHLVRFPPASDSTS